MIEIQIPGYDPPMRLHHVVLDYNGTMACEGRLIHGVKDRLVALSTRLDVHVLTADTFGSVREAIDGIPCQLTIIPREDQAQAKESYVEQLGFDGAVCIGNGRNDRLMLKEAALGIAVLQAEGAATEAVLAADVLVSDILHALDLLLYPLRLTATLRS